jgi:hypothetical protein
MFGFAYLHVGNDLRSRQRALRCANERSWARYVGEALGQAMQVPVTGEVVMPP